MGKWNIMYYFTIGAWRLALPHHALAGAFISPFVNHTCRLPAGIPSSSTTIASHNASMNTVRILSYDECSYWIEDVTTGRQEELPCTEWDYDNSTFSTTVTSEYNLVCERQYLRATYQSLYMGGFLIGSFFSGQLAYRYGRLTLIAISSVAYSVMALVSAWIPSLIILMVFRFLLGTMHPTSLVTGVVFSMEITEIKWRSTVSVVLGMMWGVGTILWGIFAYLERDWRWLQTFASLIGPAVLPFLFMLNESPRWLVVMGRHEKALLVIQKAARMNNKSLPPADKLLAIMTKVQEQSASKESKATSRSLGAMVCELLNQVIIIFSTIKLATVTVVTSIGFFTVAMIFFGLTLAASSLGISNPFLFMVISGLVELVCIFGIYFLEKMGRKRFAIFIFGLCAVALLLQPVVPADLQWISTTLIMTGKMASSSAFSLMFLYSSELYPTEVRTQGMGVGMMSSRVGAFIAPFIMSVLEVDHPWAISVVFGLMAAVASLSFLPLWETGNICLPDTIAQMEEPKEAAYHTPKGYKLVADGKDESGDTLTKV
ncbi:solute carrier family 22 member 6-B-like isoform X2 [Portunus trituberculatus]|nr:solute carrier family 22 member 6-B-like isoform X2 [Portunus trituberculatus]